LEIGGEQRVTFRIFRRCEAGTIEQPLYGNLYLLVVR
jgi:hypothetical protein